MSSKRMSQTVPQVVQIGRKRFCFVLGTKLNPSDVQNESWTSCCWDVSFLYTKWLSALGYLHILVIYCDVECKFAYSVQICIKRPSAEGF